MYDEKLESIFILLFQQKLLMNKDYSTESRIKNEHFYFKHNIEVFDFVSKNPKSDLITIHSHLKNSTMYKGQEYWLDIQEELKKSNNDIATYEDTLIDYFNRRKLKFKLDQLNQKVLSLESLDTIQSEIDKLYSLESVASDYREILDSSTITESAERYEKNAETTSKTVYSNYEKLDDTLGGFVPGRLIIFDAWLKSGKSMLVLNLAYNAWKYTNKNVLFITAENTIVETDNRFNALGAEINIRNIEQHSLHPEDKIKFNNFLKFRESNPAKIKFVFEPSINVATIEKLCLKFKNEVNNVDLVIVDQLSVCTPKVKSDYIPDIGRVAIELKNLANIQNIPIITLSQRNRAGKLAKRTGAEFASGSIEIAKFCDSFITMRIRDENEQQLMGNYTLDCEIVASRNSPLGKFSLKVFPSQMKMLAE